MATAKRLAFTLPGVTGPCGEFWTASPREGRPAVVLYGHSHAPALDIGASAAARLARAGCTAGSCGTTAGTDQHATAALAAVYDALAGGDLAPGLAPPARFVVLGYGDGVEPARTYAARQGAEFLVTWQLAAAGARGNNVDVEMIASGSHVVEHSLQLDEALDGLLAWLARVM